MIRFTQTDKWDDAWFRSLKPLEKLVFIYATERCNNAGFWEIDMPAMVFHIGHGERRLQGALEGLARGLSINDGWIWVKNFLRHQKNDKLNPANAAHRQIIALSNSQKDRFPECLELIAWDKIEGATKGLPRGYQGATKGQEVGQEVGLPSPIGIGIGNVSSLPSSLESLDSRGLPPKYPEVEAFAKSQMQPISEECTNAFFDEMEAMQWTYKNVSQIPRTAWQARFRKYATNWFNNTHNKKFQ